MGDLSGQEELLTWILALNMLIGAVLICLLARCYVRERHEWVTAMVVMTVASFGVPYYRNLTDARLTYWAASLYLGFTVTALGMMVAMA
jgi:peptidoglycan/LPS O-acetylase OafA/YrhL